MPWVVPVIMAAGAIYGGISGAAAKKEQMEAAQAAMADAASQYNGIVPPEVRNLIVEELKKQGVYSPEIEESMSAGETHWKEITESKANTDAQAGALQQMAGVSRTGFQASDRMALNKVRNEGARDQQAKEAQILQQMQARGMGGSGAELAMQLSNSQSGADQASEQSDRLAAQAQQNALAAIGSTANMASQARGDDLKLASGKANAQDEMNRFNVSNQREVAQRNVAGRNQAQAANLEESQRVYEQNIVNKRGEALRQETAKQTKFDNQMKLAAGRANALNGVATQANSMGQAAADSKQGMWSGIGQLGGNIAKAGMSSDDNSINPSTGTDRAGGSTSMSTDYLNSAHGGVVPGHASVPGDSYENDTVPVKLSPGEVVIPRSVASHPSKIPGFLKKTKSIPEQNKKESKGPSDHDLANHVVQSNALLHSLMSRIAKKAK